MYSETFYNFKIFFFWKVERHLIQNFGPFKNSEVQPCSLCNGSKKIVKFFLLKK